ncbi:hypothetical protein SEA_JALEBI_5 [Gordonia phage Jalebi]|uniref:Uncharacterized protein n=1 Tax=Gordonia phage Jalebi TaxID=2910757 RepID=A0AA49BNY4_9CAUD|nr:hypothetical protein SEA_JALEBI_5 [Gordonia phage Jalebi]WNM69354.1 hypothetical protein SEA_SAMPUDON_5 [Gordonia phage Sampudon]
MANVWYIGDAQVREWSGFQWSIWNGWSIPESAFTSGQLAELDADPGFLLGQTGPRTLPPWSPDSTVGRESVYLQQMKVIRDEIPGRLSQAALDATYVRLEDYEPGGGSTSGIHLDTDGVPYFDPSTTGGLSVLADTDGTPYLPTIGA